MIKIKNLDKSFGELHVLKNVSLEVQKGEIFGLIGKSGEGKSTLLRCINLLEKRDGGTITLNGQAADFKRAREVREYRKGVGMIFQHFSLLERQNVYKNIAAPMECWGYSKQEIDEKVRELVKIVGIEDKLYEKPRNLSGGQRQRVAIARALSMDPQVLLSDEATSALDPNTTKSILALLKDLNRKMGITVVVITHEMDVISSICDNVAIIDKGDIVERGPVKEIFESPKSHIGKQLIMGDAIKETDFSGGRYFRITFDGREAGEPVISNLVLRTKVPVNIMYAQTKAIGNKAVGEMVIQFSENEENVDSALNYLETVNIPFEEVTENDF